jgi:putative FmdB family regulatory protein
MPIYEYQCDSCGKTFEAIQKFSDDPLTGCRECGAEGVRKLLSAPAFRLKGGGWYETDFKKDGRRNVAKSDSDGGGSGSGSDGGSSKSDGGSGGSKSESKSETKSSGSKKSDGGGSGSGGSSSAAAG